MNATAQQAQDRAEAMFKRKQAQLRDAPKAMQEYQEQSRAVLEKTTRLRALRLAREARDGENPPAPHHPPSGRGAK